LVWSAVIHSFLLLVACWASVLPGAASSSVLAKVVVDKKSSMHENNAVLHAAFLNKVSFIILPPVIVFKAGSPTPGIVIDAFYLLQL